LDRQAPQRVVVERTQVPLAIRRAARIRMLQRRRRTFFALSVLIAVVALAWPGSAFGGVTKYNVNMDVAMSSRYHSGTVYIAGPHDTIETIARAVSPEHPELVRRALVASLRSTVVTAGEHVLIP
jgi:hypothetical protein